MLAAAAPTLLIAALAVLGSVPAVFLPETAELELPDTVEEMERCGVLDTMSTHNVGSLVFFFRAT